MFPARKSAGRGRRGRRPLAAGVVAFGAGAAGVLLTAPAHAGTPAPPPGLHAGTQPQEPSQAALRARLKAAVTADHGRTRASLSAPTAEKPATPPTAGPMIIGGTTTTLADAPWMAQLWYVDDKGTADTSDDEGLFCGGTVVSPTKILTAAHCVAGLDWSANGVVVTGTNQLPADDGSTDGVVSHVWTQQWSHPSFDADTYDDDVAVLTLTSTVAAKPLPIAMGDDTADYATGTDATVYGWGRTSSTSEDLSPTLRKATLPLPGDAACDTAFGADFVPGHMLCAGTPATGTDTGTTTPCNGDSGGPLVVAGKLVGVVSWGVDDCVTEGAYSVFSKVSTFAGAIVPRIFDSNDNFDDKADLIGITPAGEMFQYYSTGTGFTPRSDVGPGWTGLSIIRHTDLDMDYYSDLLIRDTTGVLWFLSGTGADAVEIGGGWNAMKGFVAPGDLNGDGRPDVFATDTSGNAYFYPGNGAGKFGARTNIGHNWQAYNALFGANDLTGDGRPDILARDGGGVLWLYPGTGLASAPWKGRVQVGTGWGGYNAFAATGDLTGDGHADWVARDSGGTLWLYKGTGSQAAPYQGRVKIGTGWDTYGLLG